MSDYKDTLNLPSTDFSMRANLKVQEPKRIEKWFADKTYEKMVELNQGKPKFLIHDGPPYANADIHMGHVLNKVLKDIVFKSKNLNGMYCPYIPGWDCHGLPIEIATEKKLAKDKIKKSTLSAGQIHTHCRDYAESQILNQMSQMQRLGIFSDWDNRYKTMDQKYEARIVRELGEVCKSGALYRGYKPVHWCLGCATALAEAEVEHSDHESPSIYVSFDINLDEQSVDLPIIAKLKEAKSSHGVDTVSVVIWTTTPWTIPSNLAIAFHPKIEYSAVKGTDPRGGTGLFIIASDLKEKFDSVTNLKTEKVLTFKGIEVEKLQADHPFMGKKSLFILGDHVNLEQGTGAVHTAPGHGLDDYIVGLKYGLEIFNPVGPRGHFDESVPMFQGEKVFAANPKITELLKSKGHLLAEEKIQHSYPHCWRCHKPVIFRNTPQWFISMEKTGLRKKALKIVGEVNWIPSWGVNRISGMLEGRPDWCISRQRIWGVPITAFFCEKCDDPVYTPEIFEHVANIIQENGIAAWYEKSIEELTPPNTVCSNCNGVEFRKETDTLDVWFDSGVSHAAVMRERNLGFPADLYLEGSDQHRGWFHTSLLTSVATRSESPYRSVLTHGFVLDQHGKKMSKSKGNVVNPTKVVETHGADLIRLWVSMVDYQGDVLYSNQSLDRVSETYRRFRNTCRHMIGVLKDFEPSKHQVDVSELEELDLWVLQKNGKLVSDIQNYYDNYHFLNVYQSMNLHCTVTLSATYLDISKDRLYCSSPNDKIRRSSQTAIYLILNSIVRSMAPILSFTAEEIWSYLSPKDFQGNTRPESVFLSNWNESFGYFDQFKNDELAERYESLFKIRDVSQKALESARKEKIIGQSLAAKVILTLPTELKKTVDISKESLEQLLIVSQTSIIDGPQLEARVEPAEGDKCPRCWIFSKETDPDGLCPRCHGVIEQLGQ